MHDIYLWHLVEKVIYSVGRDGVEEALTGVHRSVTGHKTKVKLGAQNATIRHRRVTGAWLH